MRSPSKSTWGIIVSALFALATAVGVPLASLPQPWLHALRAVSWTAFVLACLAWLLVHVPLLRGLRARSGANNPLVLLVVGVVGAGLAVGFYLLTGEAGQELVIGIPDVELRLVSPEAPSLVLENRSDVVARDIKWAAAIWNLDEAGIDPLPIPVSTFDWIRPRADGGPQQLLRPGMASAGQRLVGTIGVSCPDCSRGHTYVVSFTWGEGGWFGEAKNGPDGDLLVPKDFSKAKQAGFFEELLATVKPENRIPIRLFYERRWTLDLR